jgi:hypothetical protein
MQQLWTKRGIKGAKYLAVGVFLYTTMNQALMLVQGNHLAMAIVHLIFGVVAPSLSIAGLYLIGTRNNPKKLNE